MTQERVLGIARHILTIVGGAIVSKGITDEGTMTAIIGGAVALIGVVWSVLAKRGA